MAYDFKELNTQNTAIAKRSAEFNLAVMDAAPDLEFNEVIWKTIKGLNSTMPSPVRSAFILHFEESEEEGEE